MNSILVLCSGLAKLFFAELAKKGNTLYNVMPDIVSRLSDPEVGIAEDQFRYQYIVSRLSDPEVGIAEDQFRYQYFVFRPFDPEVGIAKDQFRYRYIVSRLSDPEFGIAEDQFRYTCKSILLCQLSCTGLRLA
jgi:hypothetical protein